MPASRYNSVRAITTSLGKTIRPSSTVARNIKVAVDNGSLDVSMYTLSESQRLDIVAGNYYGMASYWWVIAAASGIGWQCQVPAGTVLKIPVSLQAVSAFVG